ncbi:MAG: hypothetical protein ACQEXJ_05960 [Myxococcota bacterium]
MSPKTPPPDHVTVHPDGPALLVAFLVGLGVYLASYSGVLPAVRYLPVVERWTYDPPEGAVIMGYYGVLLNGTVASLLAWSVARVPGIAQRLGRPGVVRWLVRIAALAAVAAFLFVFVSEIAHWSSLER